MRQVVSLPNACRLLQVVERDAFVVGGGLGTLQVPLLQQLLDKEEKHARVPIEQVFNLVQGHVVGVARRLKGALYEVV